MPIDRPDGRHFCNPDKPHPAAGEVWVCPGDGQRWLFHDGGWAPEDQVTPLTAELEEV